MATPDDDKIEVHQLEAPPGSDRHTPRLLFLPSDICYNVAMVAQNNAFIKTEIWMEGSHVGFVSGHYLFDPHYYAEERILEFLANEVAASS